MKDKIDNQEDFTLKKIRYYQGSIEDFDTFWKKKAEQGISEESPETKACKIKNDDLNKAFEIVPVTPGDDTPEKTLKKKKDDCEDCEKVLKKKKHKDEE